jgi:glycerol-3-phosphate acyltransferase PlsY
MPAAIMILIVVWGVTFLATRYVSVASIVAAATLPLLSLWGSWFHGKIQDGTWNKALFVFSLIIGVLAIWKHRSNITRLRDGTEHRFTRKPKTGHV